MAETSQTKGFYALNREGERIGYIRARDLAQAKDYFGRHLPIGRFRQWNDGGRRIDEDTNAGPLNEGVVWDG